MLQNRLKTFKVVLLGDAGVGKSSIVMRYVNNEFYDMQESTIGAAFFTKIHSIDNNNNISLQIWDTAGQERYQSLAPMYYRDSQLILIVFDVTCRYSFVRANAMLLETTERCGNSLICLIGNKCDVMNREISDSEIHDYVRTKNILYFGTSAKTGAGVSEMFDHLSIELYENCEEKNDRRVNLNIQNPPEKNCFS